jgi:serine/threonine protein kinase
MSSAMLSPTKQVVEPAATQNVAVAPSPSAAANGGSVTPTSTGAPGGCKLAWQKGELIGQGSFGRVYLGLNTQTGEFIAVKEISFGGTMAKIKAQLASIQREIISLQTLKHPNIVRYFGSERVGNTLNIFLEYVPGGSLAQVIERFGRLDETVIRIYTKQLLEGLSYLHKHRVVHRDIKAGNALLDCTTGTVKLADFGASKQINGIATLSKENFSFTGTPSHMAPEVILQTGHGRAADVWSLGCTVLEMATGKNPWGALIQGNVVQALMQIAQADHGPPIPDDVSPPLKDFLSLCFARNPANRATVSQLARHPFITGEDFLPTSHSRPQSRLQGSSLPPYPGNSTATLSQPPSAAPSPDRPFRTGQSLQQQQQQGTPVVMSQAMSRSAIKEDLLEDDEVLMDQGDFEVNSDDEFDDYNPIEEPSVAEVDAYIDRLRNEVGTTEIRPHFDGTRSEMFAPSDISQITTYVKELAMSNVEKLAAADMTVAASSLSQMLAQQEEQQRGQALEEKKSKLEAFKRETSESEEARRIKEEYAILYAQREQERADKERKTVRSPTGNSSSQTRVSSRSGSRTGSNR